MEGRGLADAAFLQNLQEKLEFLEQKATHAKQLMEQAAALSVIKIEGNEGDLFPNKITILPTTSGDAENDTEKAEDPELIQQKEQLLQSLMSCIGDLENLDVTIAQVGSNRDEKLTTIKGLDEELSKQGIFIQELKDKTEAAGSQNAELSQKIDSAQDILHKLSAEKETFEQTLLGLEALVLATKLKLHGDSKNSQVTPEEILKVIGSGIVNQQQEESRPEEAKKEEPESLENAEDNQHPVSKLQQQLHELQSTIERLEGAFKKN